MNKKLCIVLVALLGVLQSPAEIKINYAKANAQAQREYMKPLRPGTDGINPFWNGFAKKFLFVPAFDFKTAAGAKEYLFVIKGEKGGMWSFKANKPTANLSPVWAQIPAGNVKLAVIALDQNGKQTADTVGQRKFLRDFPFSGPYNHPTRPYKEAAMKAMLFTHNLPAIHHWINSTEPDMSYSHNTYAAKIMSATIENEVLVARYFPLLKNDAVQMARNITTCLMNLSQPKGSALAYFPPTYYKGLIASARAENQGKTMTMEACGMGDVLLDLYELTKDRQYLDWALGIADTYLRLQRPDGSFPTKVDLQTGAPVNEACAMLNPLLSFWRTLQDKYGQTKYESARLKGEKWMHDVAIRKFDITGQFEDVSILKLKPYENLTNCTASTYASYLYSQKKPTKEELQDAEDLMELSEDQFTFWDYLPDENGLRRMNAPCVFEQYKYQMAVDASARNVSGGFLDKYLCTGDQLALAKATALVNQMTIMQNPVSGQIPTTWASKYKVEDPLSYWVNCCVACVKMLLRMDQLGEID